MKLILGSSSPRRKELLEQIGCVPHDIRSPDINEDPTKGELPRPYCQRMAREKLAAIARNHEEIVLSADTTVALGRRILGKPADEKEAAEFLLALGGRRHKVITAVAVGYQDKTWEFDVVSTVKFKRLNDIELNAYLASHEWRGKAGGYAIHGRAGAFIPWIQGSFSAIKGLPVAETAKILQAAGYPIYGDHS